MYPNPYGQSQQPNIGFQQQGNAPPYPPAPGYPAAGQAPGYPPAPGYPSSSPYPPAPNQAPGYPSASPYPNQAPGYPSATPYPPAPNQAPGYPSASPYPPAGQTPGYPASSGYPGFAPQQTPGYPSNTSSPYPPAGQPQYPPATTGYPSAGYTASAYPQQSAAPVGYPSQAPYASAAPISQLGSAPALGQGYPSAGMQQYQETPTIFDGPFDAPSEAQALRKAMKGFGTDEAAIINILGKRTSNQRQQIAHAFKTGYGRDLVKDLKSELGGKLEDVILALMTPHFDYLATKLNKAVSGIGTREKTLVDILCTATNHEIREINAAYARLFRKPLESELTGDTSGHFRRLLVSVNTAGRSEDPCANPSMAAEDAQALYRAGEKKMGTDEATFNLILATRSFAQIRLMLHEYERISGRSFEKAIQGEFSGDIESGFLALVKSARNRAAYFAERLHESVAGMGTKDDDLIFIVVTRAEIDMENIKQEYNKMYHKSVAQAISGDTSGDYKKILLSLIGM